MIIRPYTPNDAPAWDAFCAASDQATFLHTRRFLSYHGDRFDDASLILEDNGSWLGIFPAARHPANEGCVASHPGLSYGGMVHRGKLRGTDMIAALSAVCLHYAGAGYSSLLYAPTPAIYHRIPSQDDLYALFRLGAVRTRCELSIAIDLERRRLPGSRRRRCLDKAGKAGIRIETGTRLLRRFWPVLTDNLRQRHGVAPVHDLDEITLLADRFPENIRCLCGLSGDDVAAGILLFSTATADHIQYAATAPEGRAVGALDAVIEHAVRAAGEAGKRWFDFGISTENQGLTLNDGLHEFKSEFGGGGITLETFKLTLRAGEKE